MQLSDIARFIGNISYISHPTRTTCGKAILHCGCGVFARNPAVPQKFLMLRLKFACNDNDSRLHPKDIVIPLTEEILHQLIGLKNRHFQQEIHLQMVDVQLPC